MIHFITKIFFSTFRGYFFHQQGDETRDQSFLKRTSEKFNSLSNDEKLKFGEEYLTVA